MNIKVLLLIVLFLPGYIIAQTLNYKASNGLEVNGMEIDNENYKFKPVPLFSFMQDGIEISSNKAKASMIAGKTIVSFSSGLLARFTENGIMSVTIEFVNKGKDTITLENVVPFGTKPEHTYITSDGPWSLTRANIYRPGKGPVGVILPDNAWELGYGSFIINMEYSLSGLCRRTEVQKAEKHRYKTFIFPGGTVKYEFHFEVYRGEWQNGLKKIFRDKYLYDLDKFDNTLFEREDLTWVRHSYVAGLNFAWDKDFYHSGDQYYTIKQYLEEGEGLFGGYDIYALWPTWPRLGLDERNQWDLFRDLPGGLHIIRQIAEQLHTRDTKFFICFNPWDESTRKEDPYSGIAAIIEACDADGVVLDCRGNSNERLQEIADSIKPGVVMYSEGMAVVKDMPGIVAGRVHNAIYYSPPLNLNKLIKPEFAIFRVLENRDADLKREIAISFFNGYGVELNSMGPGRPVSVKEDLKFLGKTSMILRQNSNNFLQMEWTPLLPCIKDSIWVNKWPGDHKTLYTILSFDPQGHEGELFKIDQESDRHYISLWNHEEIEAIAVGKHHYLPAYLPAFRPEYTGGRKEGSLDCIASFPVYLSIDDGNHRLKVTSPEGDHILVWKGNPSYQAEYKGYKLMDNITFIDGSFIAGETKICIQLFSEDELIDERIYYAKAGKPWLISDHKPSSGKLTTNESILIKGGDFEFRTEQNDQFIPYPGPVTAIDTIVQGFYIDKDPVSNAHYKSFIEATGYSPEKSKNFLKHWNNGQYHDSLAAYPVVNISYEDAKAYTEWAGKRLPTELEWQFAVQSEDLNTGNVWEMTNDQYDNGSHLFIIIKGGSFYKPESSWWYIQGGVQPPERQQMLLQVSPGFDRASTLGFRCVQDK